MSKLVYSGSFEAEAGAFSSFDEKIIGYLNSIANGVGELNSSWNDDVSAQYLNGFNDCLGEMKGSLDQCHEAINQYFQDIKGVLGGASIEMPSLGSIDISAVSASSSDGSILFDDDKVVATLESMKTTAESALGDCEGFRPTVVALAGSSDDIIGAVQSNLDAGAKSYSLVNDPLNQIVSLITTVEGKYAKKISAINSAVSE